MSAILRSVSIGLAISIFLSMLGLMGVFAYGIAFAPQQIELSLGAWEIMAFESDERGAFGLTMMGQALYAFGVMVALMSVLWFAMSIILKRRDLSSSRTERI